MLELTLIPIGLDRNHDIDQQDVDQYVVDLRFGDYLILSLMEFGAWQATVHPLHQAPVDRGVFDSPADAIEVFVKEVAWRIATNPVLDSRSTAERLTSML